MRPSQWSFSTPLELVTQIRDGRYAVKPMPDKPFTFLRVSRPKRGKSQGCLIIQTQHSEWYKPAITIYPTGSLWIFNTRIDRELMITAVDPINATIRYGAELGRCSRCGRELTDERSRYYSIGPECEKYMPEVIDYIDSKRGMYVPGMITSV